MKLCNKCGQTKSFENFNKRVRSTDGYQYQCRSCEKDNHDRHYQKTKAAYVKRARANTKRYVNEYQEWKKTQVCSLCSETEPACIDFHHLDPTQKDMNISLVGLRSGMKAVLKELEKCIPVCANCHRKIHKYGLDKVKEMMR